MARGKAPDSFTKYLLQEQANTGMTDLELAYTAGSPFGAGVETVREPQLPNFYVLLLTDITYGSRPDPLPVFSLPVSSLGLSLSPEPKRSWTGLLEETDFPTFPICPNSSTSAPLPRRRCDGALLPFSEALHMPAQPMTRIGACSFPKEAQSSLPCGPVS